MKPKGSFIIGAVLGLLLPLSVGMEIVEAVVVVLLFAVFGGVSSLLIFDILRDVEEEEKARGNE